MEGAISADEYKEKKASLINQKTDHLENPAGSHGKWLEPMRDFLTLAHQASSIAKAGDPEAKRTFLKKLGSNFRLTDGSLFVSYSYPFKLLANSHQENMGWLTGVEPVPREPQSLVLPLHHSHRKSRVR